MATYCVVVPCFDEAHRLDGEAFCRFLTEDPGVHFLFVNDGSRDGTAALLKGLAARHPDRIRAIDMVRNAGKAEAIRAGAYDLGTWQRFDYAGYIDADLSAPLESVTQLRAAMEQDARFEFAMGSRVALLGRTIRRDARRHYLGRAFATIVSLMLRLPVYDTQCGAKLFRASLIDEVFREPFVTRWFFDVEILFRILQSRGREAGARLLVEVPLLAWTEKGGTKLTILDFVKTPIELARIWRHYRATPAGRSTPATRGNR